MGLTRKALRPRINQVKLAVTRPGPAHAVGQKSVRLRGPVVDIHLPDHDRALGHIVILHGLDKAGIKRLKDIRPRRYVHPCPLHLDLALIPTDPLADKWRAFGMEVSECQGNDMASVVAAIEGLQQNGKPNVIIANTTKGAGISFIQGRPEWHHRVPKGEEIALALEELKDE